jgi:hypothetical protein
MPAAQSYDAGCVYNHFEHAIAVKLTVKLSCSRSKGSTALLTWHG